MSIHAITVPQWGFSMESGKVVGWHKAVGDSIAAGDEILDLESSKIANVVEAHVAGRLRKIIAGEGEELPVGALLAVVSDGGEDDAAIDAFIAEFEEKFEAEAAAGGTARPMPEIAEIDGQPINFLTIGEGDGLPVILIHGYGGDLDNWLFNASALAEGRQVISLDLPGHGASTKQVGDGGLKALGKAVIGLMDHLGIARAHLVGHSMGGGIALLLALKHADRVASLATINGAAWGKPVNMDYVRGFAEAKRRKDMKPVAELLFADTGLVTRDLLETMLKYKRLDGVAEALAVMVAAFEAADPKGLSDSIGDLTMPVLAIWGDADRIIAPPEEGDVPGNVKQVRLTGAGHMAHMEKAAEVNEALGGHLKTADSIMHR